MTENICVDVFWRYVWREGNSQQCLYVRKYMVVADIVLVVDVTIVIGSVEIGSKITIIMGESSGVGIFIIVFVVGGSGDGIGAIIIIIIIIVVVVIIIDGIDSTGFITTATRKEKRRYCPTGGGRRSRMDR